MESENINGNLNKKNSDLTDSCNVNVNINRKIEFPLLVISKYLQNQNGLKHKDYSQYTKYCTRKLYRLRSALKMKCGKGKFQKSYLECGDYSDEKRLLLLLVLIERYWSTGMDLNSKTNKPIKSEINISNRTNLHGIRKFRKGCKLSNLLLEVSKNLCTSRSIVEAQAYNCFIHGRYYLKHSDWENGAIELDKSMKLYQQLKLDAYVFEKTSTFSQFNIPKLSKAECVKAYDDQILELNPLIRLCIYHCKRLNIALNGYKSVDSQIMNDQTISNDSKMKFCYNEKEYRVPITSLEIPLVELLDNYRTIKESIRIDDIENILQFSTNKIIECFSDTLLYSSTLSSRIHEEMSNATANKGSSFLENGNSYDWIAFESFVREFNLFVSIERDLIFILQLTDYFNNPEYYLKSLITESSERAQYTTVHSYQSITQKQSNFIRHPEEGVRICDIIKHTISEITSNENSNSSISHLTEALKVLTSNCRNIFLSHCFAQNDKFQEAYVLCDLVKSRIEIKETYLNDIKVDENGIFERIILLTKNISLLLKDMANKSFNIYLSLSVTQETLKQDKSIHTDNIHKTLDCETLKPIFSPIPVKPIMFDIALDFISAPELTNKFKKNGIVNKIFSKATSKLGIFK
ncbi:Signal recognition particle SPR68 [Cryptosporidium felis]|nr:Signal recognition particle SPR68 [Cryptosporidium felis]